MTAGADGSEVSPGVGAEIAEGLELLRSTTPDPVDIAVEGSLDATLTDADLRRHRSAVPLPALARQVDHAERRPVPPEAQAVADRIIAAAGGDPLLVDLDAPFGAPPGPPHDPNATQLRSPPGSMDTLTPTVATVRGATGEVFHLADGDELTVGRSPGAGGLVVDHPEVSRHHVRLQMRLGQLLATDLGSVNGTTAVGAEIANLTPTVAHRLGSGDRLVVNGDIELLAVTSVGASA